MTNKCLFAAGIGMQFLVYYCATNLAELNVINGKEKGGPITAIKEVQPSQAQPAPAGSRFVNVYLDNLTGDYYQFNVKTFEWKPQGNMGLHYSRAMSSLGGNAGTDMTKKGHSFKATDMGPQLFYSKLTDVKCTIKK